MRKIDILVAAASDLPKESGIAEHLICTLAAEFDIPVNICFADRPREPIEDAGGERNDPVDESAAATRPIFRDRSALEREELPEWDQAHYDLVICLLWSRFPSVFVQKRLTPSGGMASSATTYEIDSILGQFRRVSEVRRFRLYRNRATPDFPLEPKEVREEMCREWDAVQDFFGRWEKDNEIQRRECCQEFRDLDEFANLFRDHFRIFLVEELERRTGLKNGPLQSRFRGLNPFRGLNFFDFEDAAFYYGRTGAIEDVLDAVKTQATAKKSFVLVLGPPGSGKSSLLRAGVVPLLVRGGTPVGNGPWSHVITRPGVGDPIDTLAAALEAKFAAQDGAIPDESLTLTSQLRQEPENAASRLAQILGKTQTRLALVVDQLEELFVGISPVLQRKYITALCALARREGIYVIAALRSEFYPQYQCFPELLKLTSAGGRYELQRPIAGEIANMIRLPAEAAGLRFEQDAKTGRRLEDELLKAATSCSDELPLLEHVLSLLYNRQLRRKDGLLRWSDYFELGEFKNALAQHAESVFSTLNRNEQDAFKSVTRQLLVQGPGKEPVLIRRPVPYHDIVSSPKLNPRQSAAARDLIDRLTTEGLLSANPDSKHSRLISLSQDALLTNWPRLSRLVSEERHFFAMRERLDESVKLWLSRGRKSDHLLYDRIALAEGETLLREFGSALSQNQIDYVQKSVAKQKREGRARKYLGPAAFIGFVVLALVLAAERLKLANQGNQTGDVKSAQPDKSFANKDTTALEAQLKEAEAKVASGQLNAELAERQRAALQTELKTAEDKLNQLQAPELTDNEAKAVQTKLKEAEEKLAQARANSDETYGQLSAVQVKLKQEQDKAQQAQANADSLTNERDGLKNQLEQAEAKALAAQQNADLASSQRSALETQLQDAEEKLKQAQANSGNATGQLSVLQAQLKQEQDKQHIVQANADSLAAERNALQNQLKEAEAKALAAQQNADLVSSQRSALETQLKDAEAKLKQGQTNSGGAASEFSAVRAQLRDEQDKELKAYANINSLTSERDALQNQLEQAEARALLAQQNSELVNAQRGELETQLKETEKKLVQAQANSGDSASQLSALQVQLKQEQDKGQKAQANADSLTAERTALQNQLKQAEAKVLLAQQNADVASGQRSSLETQLKEAEEKLKQSQVNSGSAASQLSALQAQLKQEQEKEQKAQANADSLTNERNALQSQVKQAESKALLAQRNADLAGSQRSALEAQLRDAQEKLKQSTPSSEDTAGQVRALQARLYAPRPASPTPLPSVNAAGTAILPESQAGQNSDASGNEESLKEFVLGYLRTVASNDTSSQRRYFADQVSFYGRGVLDASSVEASTEEYHREWPTREWTPRGEATIGWRSRHRDRFAVYQPFRWAVSDGSRHAQGNATLYLLIQRDPQGEFRILNVHQLDR
jgi:conflict system STAND superfamily ATPase